MASVQRALARHVGEVVAGGEQRRPGVVGVVLEEAGAGVPHLPDGVGYAARVSGGGRPRERGTEDVVETGQLGFVGEPGEHGVHGPAKSLTGHR